MTQLTPYQMELLGILQEECAEVIQIISKIRRFGIASFNPALEEDHETNQDLLNLEVGDVLALIDMIKETENSPLIESTIEERVAHKKLKVVRYLRS